MKKFILGTTALIAVSALTAGVASAAEEAKPIKLGLSGYLQTSFVVADYDSGDQNPTDIRHEGEVHFTGKTTLDNGLTFGVNIQLEARESGDQVDETFMWVAGSFGRINMGSENSASYLMHYGSPSATTWAWSLNSSNANASGMPGGSTYTTDISDADKITYFTPRFSGFQLGASFTPDSDSETAGAKVYLAIADEGTADEGYSLGANYVSSFNDVSVAASIGYEGITRSTGEDSGEFSIGTQIGFSGFKVGAAYKYGEDQGGVDDAETHDWNAGVTYGMGPWTVGFQYGGAALEDAAGDGERHAFQVGGSYILGPGITAFGGVQYWDADDDYVASVGSATGEDAIVLFVGTFIGF